MLPSKRELIFPKFSAEKKDILRAFNTKILKFASDIGFISLDAETYDYRKLLKTFPNFLDALEAEEE